MFLLALCSTNRLSELHALCVHTNCMRWKPENTAVSLWLNPFFLPKMLNPQSINSAIELEAFHPDPACQTGVALHTLWPVRALRAYVDRTQQLRRAHAQLFVCYGAKQLHPVSKQHLSHWLVDTIAQAYFEQGLPVPEGLVAHSARSMATSWAMRGCSWWHLCGSILTWSTLCTSARIRQAAKCWAWTLSKALCMYSKALLSVVVHWTFCPRLLIYKVNKSSPRTELPYLLLECQKLNHNTE